MVSPISNLSVALPTELVNVDMSNNVVRPVNQVQASNDAQNSGSSTTGHNLKQQQQSLGDTESSLDRMLNQINDSMDAWSTGMRFDVDEEAQRVVVSIVDSKTGDVIRTVPSDAVIQIAKMITKLQGTAVDTKA